jgi:ArsR family transcriptional regulator, arsenate/arsenite/antimonite-responsive transcriptional repressor
MGITKTDNFSSKQNELSVLLKAIAHPARIAIIEYLLKSDKCICGDIVNEIPLSQPTVSQHLRELKNAGLIAGEIEGNSICYCINDKAWSKLKRSLENLFEKYEKNKVKNCL